jgi:hypothetical protein
MPQKLHVATRKGLFLLEGPDFQLTAPAFPAIPVTRTMCDPRTGWIFASLNHGHFGVKLHRSKDEGATWEEIACPALGKEHDASVSLLWELCPSGPARPGGLLAGTIPGGLSWSGNNGDSWKLNENLWNRPERKEWMGGGYDHPGIHSICVDPVDINRVAICISTGGVWLTPDAGETWELRAKGLRAEYMPPERQFEGNIQDGHRMVQCQGEPRTFWIQHHNGVFVSRDALESWQELSPPVSGFGFAVAVHPQDGNTAWFAPLQKDEFRVPVDAKLVVTRTRDGGQSFEVLSQGLPSPSYDMAYRHSLDVDSTGNRLALGSTTGGLWVSDDQGDNWRTISQNLPPIYSVAWA